MESASDRFSRLSRAATALGDYESARRDLRDGGGQLLRTYRRDAGLTLRQFSDLFDVAPTYVSKVENGHVPLSVELAAEMARKASTLVGRKPAKVSA